MLGTPALQYWNYRPLVIYTKDSLVNSYDVTNPNNCLYKINTKTVSCVNKPRKYALSDERNLSITVPDDKLKIISKVGVFCWTAGASSGRALLFVLGKNDVGEWFSDLSLLLLSNNWWQLRTKYSPECTRDDIRVCYSLPTKRETVSNSHYQLSDKQSLWPLK